MDPSKFEGAPQLLQHNHRQHSLLGVESLFQDFKDSRDLELDFAADLGPMGCRVDSWPSHVGSFPSLPPLPSNYLGLGGQPDLPRSQPDLEPVKWRGLDMQTDVSQLTQPRNYNGSANSMISFNPQFSSNHSTNPSCMSEALLSVEDTDEFRAVPVLPQLPQGPKLEPARISKTSSRQAEKIEREREKAEKLKEKNKRAQRKFRQRQKDKQETAEKLAQDLAEQLKRSEMEKESLALRNQELEQSLQYCSRPSDRSSPAKEEPTFKPAEGWTVYNPKQGMVLVAITNAKLTHDMIMRLSLRDFVKLMAESVRRMEDTLESYDKDPSDQRVCKRLKALVNERHALLSYIAINKPQALYQIICTKMVDPPEENCPPLPLEAWEKFLEGIVVEPQQMANIVDARMIYIRKMGELLKSRDELRKELCRLRDTVEPQDVPLLPEIQLEWMQVIDKLKENLEMFHKCHAYFMARIWYGDCLNFVQVARVITRAFPYSINVYAIVRVLTIRQGLPNHRDILLSETVKHEEGPNALDQYLTAFPGACLDASNSRKLESDGSSVCAIPELYTNFSSSLALESSGGSSQF